MRFLLIILTLSLSLTPILSDCNPNDCLNKCCINGACSDDILKCGLQKNRDFTALIASLALVAFFVLGSFIYIIDFFVNLKNNRCTLLFIGS